MSGVPPIPVGLLKRNHWGSEMVESFFFFFSVLSQFDGQNECSGRVPFVFGLRSVGKRPKIVFLPLSLQALVRMGHRDESSAFFEWDGFAY